MVETGTHIAFIILLLAFVIALFRLIKGPSLPDRVVSLDLISSLIIGICVVFVFVSGKVVYINIALIIAPIFFLGTVTIAKYLKSRAKND